MTAIDDRTIISAQAQALANARGIIDYLKDQLGDEFDTLMADGNLKVPDDLKTTFFMVNGTVIVEPDIFIVHGENEMSEVFGDLDDADVAIQKETGLATVAVDCYLFAGTIRGTPAEVREALSVLKLPDPQETTDDTPPEGPAEPQPGAETGAG